MKFKTITILITASLLVLVNALIAQTLTQFGPDGFVRIEEGSGGFFADLDAGDRFSRDHDVAGDINGDGILDLVIGARSDDDGETDAGAVYIVFMNTDGTVQSNQKISMLEGDFSETLNESNFFGYGVAGIGDYDGDDIPDIAVSAPASTNRALYIIHLNVDGTVKNYVKHSDIIAQGLSAIGDLNNDGRIDLVACDPNSDVGGTNRGAIDILFLDDASQIVNTVTINSSSGGFGSGLENSDMFGGREVAMLGDIDNDGTLEMAVGAFMSDGGKGAVWILSLDPTTYNVVSKLKITEGLNGFNDTLIVEVNPNGTAGAQFGHAMCAPGDLNGDGIPDLITGANQQGLGDAYILYLNNDKTVKTYTKVDELEGGFNLDFDSGDEERFSRSMSFIGDLRGDGTIAVNVGGGVGPGGTGTLYLLFFKPCDFAQEPGLNHWSGGNTLFTNWSHNMQMLTSDSLTFEQCTFKAFETDAAYMTYNYNDGRCICKDSTAVLTTSTELSTAYSNECFSGFISTNINVVDAKQSITIFPNPTNADIVLSTTETSFSEKDEIILYNLMGVLLFSSNIIDQETSINLSSYPSGVYLVRSSINGVYKTFKVVKE
ncbi:MAG: T9SS type A sorting domain-containing protein [Saprospiraceae bacterium]